jgi:CheY-like chemotaxis protein
MRPPAKDFKLLVADDSHVYRKLLEDTLSEQRYSTLFAKSGREAMELFAEQQPDLVITDWMMPDIPGVELCKRMREGVKRSYTYIIILTGITDKREISAGLSAGADDYLTKPFAPEELRARIGVGCRIIEFHRQIDAIAHMKIGLKLHETGYQFRSNVRARIYLTNTLEPPSDAETQREFEGWAPALAHESQAVSGVKRLQRFTVVIGNPPYAGISSNMTQLAQQIVDAYKVVDGHALNERKLWLQDDYVKFVRIAQTTIERAGNGILGYVTNHGYIDNPTFRGMRQSLAATFQRIRVLDLHGNANKKEQSPDGSKDENVFDIRQGVAILLGTSISVGQSVQHTDIWGSRENKYAWLGAHSVTNISFEPVSLQSPYYFFEPQQTRTNAEYDSAFPVNKIFPLSNSGIVTARDGFVLDLDLAPLRERIAEFRNPRISDAEIKKRFDLAENYMWRVSQRAKHLWP